MQVRRANEINNYSKKKTWVHKKPLQLAEQNITDSHTTKSFRHVSFEDYATEDCRQWQREISFSAQWYVSVTLQWQTET